MAPIGAAACECRKPNLVMWISISRLARHLSVLGKEDAPVDLSLETCCIAALCLKNVRSLYCNLLSLDGAPVVFPPSLTWLEVYRDEPEPTPSQVNALIVSVARLPLLRTAKLNLVHLDPLISFAPFVGAPCLRELGLFGDGFRPNHIAEIRTMKNLTNLIGTTRAQDLSQILRAPHELQRWQTLSVKDAVSEEFDEIVASLPELTDLSTLRSDRVSFLQHAPNLRKLSCIDLALTRDQDQVFQGLGSGQWCTRLTDLTISCSKMAALHVNALLAQLPELRMLSLDSFHQLESLSFLASGSLARTLTHFAMSRCRHLMLRTEEMCHLLVLQQLTSLNIRQCFSDHMNSFTLKHFSPPTACMPKLAVSIVDCDTPAEE